MHDSLVADVVPGGHDHAQTKDHAGPRILIATLMRMQKFEVLFACVLLGQNGFLQTGPSADFPKSHREQRGGADEHHNQLHHVRHHDGGQSTTHGVDANDHRRYPNTDDRRPTKNLVEELR